MPKGIYKHKPHTEEHKHKISIALKKVVHSEERNKKISVAKMGNTCGRFNKGKKHTTETKLKFSMAHRGSKSSTWKGGISFIKGWKAYHGMKRRVLELNAKGSYTFEEWEVLKGQYQFMCACCKKTEPEIKLTVDHIIPLSKGGSNDITNIQPLCGSCNSRKSTKTILYPIFNSNYAHQTQKN